MTDDVQGSEGDFFAADAKAIEEMRHHIKGYIGVFVALLALTAVTVGIAYLHLPHPLSYFVGILIACIKGSLVAAYFMHLISEKKLIYSVLILTAIFFVVMMSLPMGQWADPGATYEP